MAEKKEVELKRKQRAFGTARGTGTTYSCLHSTVKDRARAHALFAKRRVERRARK